MSSSSVWRGSMSARPRIETVSSPVIPRLCQDAPSFKDQRQNAHAHEVGAVDTLKALGDHGAHAEQVGALGRPVTRGAGAVFLAGKDHQRRALGLVCHGRVIDRHDFARSGDLVKPPSTPSSIWFLMRILAKVPRIITS